MILDKFKLDGKVAVVTGGGRGCVFPASPASDYVTGFMCACDGGWLAR